MNKKVIIDLNGVIFKPIDAEFAGVARREYGRVKGAAVTMAYKYGIARRVFNADIANVMFNCANNATVRDGALEALDAIVRMPNVTLEFCSQIAFPGQAHDLEKKYRAMAPCMNAAAHYELISPFKSKRDYIQRSTASDGGTQNYIIENLARNLDWPVRWRIVPVLVYATQHETEEARRHYTGRIFENLAGFKDFLSRRR